MWVNSVMCYNNKLALMCYMEIDAKPYGTSLFEFFWISYLLKWCLDLFFFLVMQLEKLEQETIKWCREILRNSPTAIRVLKSALNAVDDGHAGLQVLVDYSFCFQFKKKKTIIISYLRSDVFWFAVQEIGGDATLLFYGTEEGNEGKTAYLERRPPDFSKFPRRPWWCGNSLHYLAYNSRIFLKFLVILREILHCCICNSRLVHLFLSSKDGIWYDVRSLVRYFILIYLSNY